MSNAAQPRDSQSHETHAPRPRGARAGDAAAARAPIVGVMGAGTCDEATYARARALGTGIARAGYTLLCGGGTGVMEAAARGAWEAGGATIGILPGRDAGETPPNRYIEFPLYSGIFYARNLMNVLSADVVAAVAGGLGTLSEIALALKCGRPVVALGSWDFRIDGFTEPEHLYRVTSTADALERIAALLAASAPRS